jgi:hypothetical protein
MWGFPEWISIGCELAQIKALWKVFFKASRARLLSLPATTTLTRNSLVLVIRTLIPSSANALNSAIATPQGHRSKRVLQEEPGAGEPRIRKDPLEHNTSDSKATTAPMKKDNKHKDVKLTTDEGYDPKLFHDNKRLFSVSSKPRRVAN